MIRIQSRGKILIGALLLVAGSLYFFSLPDPLFSVSYSTILKDRQGQLLSAAIAKDGQWRFPSSLQVPEKYATAVVSFEDKRFRSHWGVDGLAMARAIRQNAREGRIISGGSTLSMQVIRLSRKAKDRNLWNKVVEMLLATRLELRYTKNEILSLYAAHAPFGGNVVGLEAACWRYFAHDPMDLSWSEAALLAVLPNNPSLIHLSRNRGRLQEKRNSLLKKLYKAGTLDSLTLHLSMAEPVPEAPRPIPRKAQHLLDRVVREGSEGKLIKSTIDGELQVRVTEAVDAWQERISGNQVFNAAVLVMNVRSGAVLAYVGNAHAGKQHHEDVDMIRASRSTGSILKPFLFAAMLDEGKLLPGMLVSDVPVLINGYEPKNFSRQYDGAVPAGMALIRSLNIPAVQELREYRYEKFHHLLDALGMTTLSKGPDHYGLSLVLGGAEGTLWDITGMYASCSRALLHYFEFPGSRRYDRSDFHSPKYDSLSLVSETGSSAGNSTFAPLSAAAIWSTWETLREMYRPGEETGWQSFASAQPIAWKTGTSFGLRDAWAVGVTPDYAVGVWAGNADGEGRPGLTGTEMAAPLLFNIFSILPGREWFRCPESEMRSLPVCKESGHLASMLCTSVDTVRVPATGVTSRVCPYHQRIHLTKDHAFRVHGNCADISEISAVSWFILPPVQEYYYRRKNLDYKPVPPYRPDCAVPAAVVSMDMVYPRPGAKIYLPVQLDGSTSGMVALATHRYEKAVVFWHLDGQYLGTTTGSHKIMLRPRHGQHELTLVDGSGEILQRNFEVISTR